MASRKSTRSPNLVEESHRAVVEIGAARKEFSSGKMGSDQAATYIGLFNSTARILNTAILAEKWDKDHPHKAYDTLSPKALDIVRSVKMSADGDGNIKLGSRAIKALKEVGAINSSEHTPKQFTGKGGFSGD